MEDNWATRQTLLNRAKDPQDQQAWEEFVAYYRNFIAMIIAKMNLPAAEADDLIQEVMLKLWRNLDVYNRERAKFRTWLGGITRNTILKHLEKGRRRRQREGHAAEDELYDYLHSSSTDLEFLIESEWKSYLTSLALENLKKIFSGKAVQAFELSLQELSVEEICTRLDLKKESLYVLRSRVKHRFVEEVRHLVAELEF